MFWKITFTFYENVFIFAKAIFYEHCTGVRLKVILLFLTLKSWIWCPYKSLSETRLSLMPLLINRTKGRVINTSLLSPACKALPTFRFQSLLLPACKKSGRSLQTAGDAHRRTTSIVAGCARFSPADPIITNAPLSLRMKRSAESEVRVRCCRVNLQWQDKAVIFSCALPRDSPSRFTLPYHFIQLPWQSPSESPLV